MIWLKEREVILGVDTHLDVHVAVLIDAVGRVVAMTSVPTTALGYEHLIEWHADWSPHPRQHRGNWNVRRGACRTGAEHGVPVLEISRPDRSRRRLRGRTTPPTPKTRLGQYWPERQMPSRKRSRAWWKQCGP